MRRNTSFHNSSTHCLGTVDIEYTSSKSEEFRGKPSLTVTNKKIPREVENVPAIGTTSRFPHFVQNQKLKIERIQK